MDLELARQNRNMQIFELEEWRERERESELIIVPRFIKIELKDGMIKD